MDGICLGDEWLEYPGSEVSYEITQYVHHDDGRCSKLDVESLFKTDDERHCHCKYGQKQLVFYSCQPAAKSDDCVEKGENMDDPGCLEILYRIHISSIQHRR